MYIIGGISAISLGSVGFASWVIQGISSTDSSNITASVGSLSDFIDDFFKFVGDEREEDTKWQFFLHKVFDKSWKEFCDEIESINKSDEVDLGATIKKSHDMLTNFTPT